MLTRTPAGRTAPRQTIVALYEPSTAWPALSLPLALDVVTTMCAANGFSVALACSLAAAKEVAAELPAGVDLRTHLPGATEPAAMFFARLYAERGFERIILLSADTIGVSTRLISTTSSILGVGPLAVGLTPRNGLYLAGVSGESVVRQDGAAAELLAAFGAGLAPTSLDGRRLERLSRLAELTDRHDLNRAIGECASLLPRTMARMRDGI